MLGMQHKCVAVCACGVKCGGSRAGILLQELQWGFPGFSFLSLALFWGFSLVLLHWYSPHPFCQRANDSEISETARIRVKSSVAVAPGRLP